MTEERAVNESLVKIVFWQLPVASPGRAKRNCPVIIQSLPPSSLTFLLLPQRPGEFLDVTISPWEMWQGERMSILKTYFYIMS